MQKTLVAFDADRIKSYVFGTNKLKEIRGASALLDDLNRQTMRTIAKKFDIHPIYTNGGQGLFVVIADKADKIADQFGQAVKKAFSDETEGGASVTYVRQALPADLPDELDELMKVNLKDYFRLLQIQMDVQKGCRASCIALPSHPLMRLCDACGLRYAETRSNTDDEPEDQFYCNSCRKKQVEDNDIKIKIKGYVKNANKNKNQSHNDPLRKTVWERIIFYLNEKEYDFSLYQKTVSSEEADKAIPERPQDFDDFSKFSGTKDYIALIYADANNMGVKVTAIEKLQAYEKFADAVDKAIHEAMSQAIKEHLPLVQVTEGGKTRVLFPFDIFLVGGDDIVMLTDASKAMDVALTIAKKFRALTDEAHTLSIGVVMAPIKYPFRLMLGLAEEVLKDAKKASAKARQTGKPNDSRISFRIVNGGMHADGHNSYHKTIAVSKDEEHEFYATLRPYSPEQLEQLLVAIREGRKIKLGRTKLHQLREAVLKMNTTTSVIEGMAVLHNWRAKQREHVVQYHLKSSLDYLSGKRILADPVAGLPNVLFPWFIEKKSSDQGKTEKKGSGQGKKEILYRTPLLDLVELYDFVGVEKDGMEEGENTK